MSEIVLELRGITKSFGNFKANDNINITLHKGEILALLGENGAGKTTLMNVLYGLYKPDLGEIYINGQKVNIQSPLDAINAGIGMVHQHFMLIPVFTVTENVMLGNEQTKYLDMLDRAGTATRIRKLSDAYKLQINPDALVGDLSVGLQQRIEIIKLLYRNADILIMDEPSAVLTPKEVDELFLTVRSLVEEGKSIIFITHKLREVMEISNRICVIRAGKVVGEALTKDADVNQLAALMVGRPVNMNLAKSQVKAGKKVLEVENISILGKQQKTEVNRVSFDVREGEIFGIAGVQGNGQTELVRALVGLIHPIEGRIKLLGEDITKASPRKIIELGTAHIPEDRQADGLVLQSEVSDNLILNRYYLPPFAKKHLIQTDAINQNAATLVESYDVRPRNPHVPVAKLSGGNQQKVIIARELSRPIKLVIAAQPTRGLDVGSIEYTQKRLLQLRDEGCAVLLVSTELDEIMQLSDRVGIMYRGSVIAIHNTSEVAKEDVGLLMAGVDPAHPERVPTSQQLVDKSV